MLSRANKNMLYVERIKKIALFVYKSRNSIGPASLHNFFTKKDIPYDLRDSSKLVQKIPKTTSFGLHSLKYSGAALWNTDIPKDFKKTSKWDEFEKLIKTWNGPSCHCNICNLCKISS